LIHKEDKMTALGNYNLTSSDGTTAKFTVGTEINIKGCQFGYFLAAGNINAFDACTVSNTSTAVAGTTTTSGAKPTLVCIPQFAVASGEYFWAPVGPFTPLVPYGLSDVTFKVNAALNCAADVKLYTTATVGVVDDTATDLIIGLLLTETITTARAANCIAVTRLGTNIPD